MGQRIGGFRNLRPAHRFRGLRVVVVLCLNYWGGVRTEAEDAPRSSAISNDWLSNIAAGIYPGRGLVDR